MPRWLSPAQQQTLELLFATREFQSAGCQSAEIGGQSIARKNQKDRNYDEFILEGRVP
jgi:hypothetical protein